MTESPLPVSSSDIVSKGSFYLLDDYAMREDINRQIMDTFLEGVEVLESKACRDKVEQDGLSQLHRHFPVEKVLLLEDFLMKKLKSALYYWTYKVCVDDMGLDKEFFVDNLIMFRVHYPYEIAVKAGKVESPPFPWHVKVGAALADLKNPAMFGHRFRDFKRNTLGRWLGILDESNSYTPEKYHNYVPKPARAHGAHIDTWYGHSFDGINLWLSVAGVNRDNTVILYPEMFGHKVDYEPASMYLKPGIPLTKPYKVEMKPGQLLLFNPEMLHGTQVNISGETRVAITTRVNPDTPRFEPGAGFHFQHWHSSKDLARGNTASLSVFPASQYEGHKSVPDQVEPLLQKTIKLTLHESLKGGKDVAVCDLDVLPVGEKMAVDLQDARILIYRSGEQLFAMSRRCCHRGIDMIDGFHDDEHIYCPGHGVAYSFSDGTSPCKSFKQGIYQAYASEGKIWLKAA